MRRNDREVLSQEWMLDVLREGTYLELALCGGVGQPYVLQLNYGVGDGYLTLHGAKEGLKIDLIKANPRAAFNVTVGAEIIRHPDTPSKFSCKYRSVSGHGRIRFVEDLAEKKAALELLMRHYDGPTAPMPEAMLQSLCVMVLDIAQMTGKVNRYEKPAE